MAMPVLVTTPGGLTTTQPEAGPSRLRLQSLPYTIDFRSPLNLPPRSGPGLAWPATVSGPANGAGEDVNGYVRRRYRETLFLPEVIATLADFALDIRSVFSRDEGIRASADVAELLGSMLLSLPHVEHRHRKTLAPVICGHIAAAGIRMDCKLDEETRCLLASIALRGTSRKAVEEAVPTLPKRLSEELERREILMQIILLLLFIPHHTPRREKKKRKRRRSSNGPDDAGNIDPTEDPTAALEVLIDRLSIWLAVSELGIDQDAKHDNAARDMKGKVMDKENLIQKLLKHFWENVISPFFVPTMPEQASMFHLKVFGTKIPSNLLPHPLTSKKPRKPKVTRARPSTDDIPLSISDTSARPAVSHRTSSKPPSEAGSRVSPSRDLSGSQMRRSLSRNSETITEYRRSRSRSVDPSMPRESAPLVNKKSIVRAPSGKDLFKGREVIRRTNSIMVKKARVDGESQGPKFGLLGRKTSDGKERRQDESQRKSETLPAKPPNTIIFATPSKPRLFGSRAASWNPTPIQEEPSSAVRPSFIAETPVNPNRISDVPLSGLTSVEEDDDDALGDLMVMTDEEDGDDDGATAMVPETPAR